MTDKLICAREDCTNVIEEKKKFNQKYCSYECCKVATNARIMEKYYERKERMSGKPRYCKECKTAKLSKYNYGDMCFACQQAKQSETNKLIDSLFEGIELVQ
jgi:hypothetical protein